MIAASAMVMVSAATGGCIFGGDDDDPGELVPTATSAADEATNTPAAQSTVAGATTTVASPTPAERTHTVAAGESLGVIANEYGVSVQAIVDANGIEDPNVIFPGQELVIPPAPASQ